jgi:hypothetical protein
VQVIQTHSSSASAPAVHLAAVTVLIKEGAGAGFVGAVLSDPHQLRTRRTSVVFGMRRELPLSTKGSRLGSPSLKSLRPRHKGPDGTSPPVSGSAGSGGDSGGRSFPTPRTPR